MSGWVAQVDDERVEVVGEASRRGGVAALVELVDERLEPLLGVALVDCVIERLPVGLLDAFAFALGQLGVEVAARCMQQRWRSDAGQHCSIALISPGAPSATISIGAPSPRAIRSRPSSSQSSEDSRIPSVTESSTRSPSSVNPQATRTPSLGPSWRTAR
jgi:hypothetical protein